MYNITILHIFLAFFKENLYLCRGKTEQYVRDAIHSHGADDDYHGDADRLPALDSAYSIAFPHSTPINVNKKKGHKRV